MINVGLNEMWKSDLNKTIYHSNVPIIGYNMTEEFPNVLVKLIAILVIFFFLAIKEPGIRQRNKQ